MSVIADPFHGTGEGSVLGFQRSTPCSPCVWHGETNVTLAAGLASAEATASETRKTAKALRTSKCLNIQRRRKEGSNLHNQSGPTPVGGQSAASRVSRRKKRKDGLFDRAGLKGLLGKLERLGKAFINLCGLFRTLTPSADSHIALSTGW